MYGRCNHVRDVHWITLGNSIRQHWSLELYVATEYSVIHYIKYQ